MARSGLSTVIAICLFLNTCREVGLNVMSAESWAHPQQLLCYPAVLGPAVLGLAILGRCDRPAHFRPLVFDRVALGIVFFGDGVLMVLC